MESKTYLVASVIGKIVISVIYRLNTLYMGVSDKSLLFVDSLGPSGLIINKFILLSTGALHLTSKIVRQSTINKLPFGMVGKGLRGLVNRTQI